MIALINKWDIVFNYSYASAFKKIESNGKVKLEGFSFKATVQLYDITYLKILNLDLNLGNSTLEFKNAPVVISIIQWFINLKWPTTFMVNKVVPFFYNIFAGWIPLELSMPLFSDYFLDIIPVKQITNNINASTILYSAFEVYSTRKGRLVVPTPKSLDKKSEHKENSIEIAINNYTISTLIASLAKNNELGITLTDGMVYNATKVLHLRANTFSYFIPGLKKYGEDPLTIHIKFDESMVVNFTNKNYVIINGGANSIFFVDKVEPSVVEMDVKTLFSLTLNLGGKLASAKLIDISIQSLKFKKCEGEKPDENAIKNEFNAFFKVVVGIVNNYILNQDINIQEIINVIPFIKIDINNLQFEASEEIAKVGINMTIT